MVWKFGQILQRKRKIQQVLVYNGIKPEQMESVPAGNVLAISGLDIDVGETITVKEQTPLKKLNICFSQLLQNQLKS